jgi:integrase/recombinase XerC
MDIGPFLLYLQHEKRFSPHTQGAYRKDLGQFLDFIVGQYGGLGVGELQRFHIRSWIIQMVEDGLKPSSIRRKVSAARAYFAYLMRSGEISSNPMQYLFSPKIGKRLPTVAPENPLLQMLATYTAHAVTFAELRDALVLELLYQTGMRRGELIALTLEHTDLGRMELRVVGKGNKVRIIPISRGLADLAGRYLAERARAFPEAAGGPLLLTDKGEALYPKWVYNLVHSRLASVPGLEKRSPHVLRHSFATHLADHGADLNAIKTLLGHANLSATEIYTHHTMGRLRKIYEQAHPKAREED